MLRFSMKRLHISSVSSVGSLSLLTLFLVLSLPVFGQQPVAKSQEVSDIDGKPVLLLHLPDYETVQGAAVFVTDKNALRNAVGDRPVLEVVEFPPGTEAATASYDEGRLVIVEYTNPQASIDADEKIQAHLSANQQIPVVYRRIGNYNTFVFDAADAAAANALLDEVKYQKTVQWLGEDPYLIKKLERYMMATSRDIAISTVLVILLGLGTAILTGIVAGLIFFRVRDQKRAGRAAFSDAGGLTRLNLDGLSE
jgi:hypothetical protein